MPGRTDRTTGSEEMTAEDGRKNWAALLSAAQWQGRHTVITRSGKRAAVVVPPDWYSRAEALIAADDAAKAAKKSALQS